jgi:vacuolar-type H+-ATPase subunit D/Vma8
MTEAEMKEQIQIAQDMIAGLESQRNAAQNEVIQLAAQVRSSQRKITALEAQLAEATKPAADESDADVLQSKANGHAEAHAAA